MNKKRIVLISAFALLAGSGAAFATAACCGGGSAVKQKVQAVAACCGGAAMQNHQHPQQAMTRTAGQASQQSQALVSAYEALANAVFDGEMQAVQEKAAKVAAVARKQEREELAGAADAVAETADIDAARRAFTSLSRETIAAVEKEPGYFVMKCPMVQNGEWLQSSKDIHNPYMGESMPRCGFVQRQTGSSSSDQGA